MAREKKVKSEDLLEPVPPQVKAELESQVTNLRKRKYTVPPLRWSVDTQGLEYRSAAVHGYVYVVRVTDDERIWELANEDGDPLAEGTLADMLLTAEIELHENLGRELAVAG